MVDDVLRPTRFALALLALAACHHESPEDAARADYARLKPTLDALDAHLGNALRFVSAGDPYRDCTDDACLAQKLIDAQHLRDGITHFRTDVLPDLVRGTPVLGLEITARFDDANVEIATLEPSSPGSAPGVVDAAHGVVVEEPAGTMGNTAVGARRLGWGSYQTAWAAGGAPHGDAAFHRGIEVAWSNGYGLGASTHVFVHVDVRMVLLADGFSRSP